MRPEGRNRCSGPEHGIFWYTHLLSLFRLSASGQRTTFAQPRLDWFHVARRIARIEKEFLYPPYGDDFQERLAAHWANLNSMKWMLWNDGVDMAEFGTKAEFSIVTVAFSNPR
jgi:hypothetical protein